MRTFLRFLPPLLTGVSLVLCAAVLSSTWDQANGIGLTAMVFLLVAGAILGRRSFSSPDLQVVLLLILLLTVVPFSVVTKVFGHLDMLAFMFHLEFGAEGTAFEGMELEIATSCVAALLFFLAAWMLRSALNSRWLLPIICAALVFLNPLIRYYAKSILYTDLGKQSLASELAVPKYSPTPTTDQPDVIVIYLEGLERGYSNREKFGSIYDPIAKLAERGIEFREVQEFPATGNSISGNVATQCGLPLLPNGFRAGNTFTEQVKFLGNSICLGDILSDRGYFLSFNMGATMDFAGFDHFFLTHQFDKLFGAPNIMASFPKEEVARAQTSWGTDDQMLLDFAFTKYMQAPRDRPIGLFIQTMGPHGKSSHLSRRCTDDKNAKSIRDPAPAVECLAELSYDFVQKLETQAPDRKRLFILVSDHLAHKASATPILEKGPRRNTFIAFGSGIQPGLKNDKTGSLVDVFPTILELLDIGSSPYIGGFGVSLLSKQPTYMESYDYKDLHWRISRDVELGRVLWAQ